jgi:hypothetical protein
MHTSNLVLEYALGMKIQSKDTTNRFPLCKDLIKKIQSAVSIVMDCRSKKMSGTTKDVKGNIPYRMLALHPS